jgi:hypothetical protein
MCCRAFRFFHTDDLSNQSCGLGGRIPSKIIAEKIDAGRTGCTVTYLSSVILSDSAANRQAVWACQQDPKPLEERGSLAAGFFGLTHFSGGSEFIAEASCADTSPDGLPFFS